MKKKIFTQGLSLMLILIGFLFPRLPLAQTTERNRIGLEGQEPDGESFRPAISANGRFVAFYSLANNLVSGDANDDWDIFVYDRQTGTTERFGVAQDGEWAGAGTNTPALSADGRFVAFISEVTNPDDGDADGGNANIFVHDRQIGTTERVTVGLEEEEPNSFSYQPILSADGRFVAFDSEASNLVAENANNGDQGIFLRDRGPAAVQNPGRSDVNGDGLTDLVWRNTDTGIPPYG